MYVISGVPRSGTSLTMAIMHAIFGKDRIIGEKFPAQGTESEEVSSASLVDEDSSPIESSPEIESFLSAKRVDAFSYNQKQFEKRVAHLVEKRKKHARDMNPNGFYEMPPYSVTGLTYNQRNRHQINEWVNSVDPKIMKIVAQGLLGTDPRYIDKVVYLCRDPRSVAKSHEKLINQLDTIFGDKPGYKRPRIHTPRHYINWTKRAARFFQENPDIPVLFVKYNDLINKPKKTIQSICEFLEVDKVQGWQKAKGIVDPTLKRSEPDLSIKNDLWEEAEQTEKIFERKEYKKLRKYLDNPNRKINQKNTSWYCPRAGRGTNKDQCLACINKKDVQEEYKKFARFRGIDWENQPCLFECGLDFERPDEELLTVDQSIEMNFWMDV